MFHLGVIRRLLHLNLFDKIDRINSVSGGSIAAGMVMKEVSKARFQSLEDFDQRVIRPVILFIQESPRGNIYKVIPIRRDPEKFANLLDMKLFHGISFRDLAKAPEWTCYATSLNSAYSWKFSQIEIGDSPTGHTQPTEADRIALGVAASACFPPLFRPLRFSTKDRSFMFKYVEGKRVDRINPSPPDTILLTDGGVYDNLGSESVITKKSPFIVSDASGIARHWRHEVPGLIHEVKRPIDIAMDQNGKLRRRLLYDVLLQSDQSILIEAAKPLSTYTSIVNPKKDSPTPPGDMPGYPDLSRDLEAGIGEIRTDLNAFHDVEIQLLIWNGMAKTDAALKRWIPSVIDPTQWNAVPTIKGISLDSALDILQTGKKLKVWGQLHKQLHSDERKKFVEHITAML
ncbi:hypothetical protein ATW55_14885 [Ferroacidibacillus organovorans]|uniref:PNPLA domain-containing protein n=1 Tax=Ferroacidibacillus organovorans TaxID=1765683 RepID=A0A124IVZ9_9BACL|nr:hypothetical protein ATW55_14885 [Ferroacidibacillus organovorans]